MTYEDFEKFVQERCMYETIYDDSDGRRILVIRLLDVYGMVNKAAAAEREACAKVCEARAGMYEMDKHYWDTAAQECAFAIRERGAPALERMNKAAEDNGEPL